MKSFSPIKLFTPVMFFLVMCLTMISWGSYKTSEECQTSKRIEKKTECDNEKTQESKSFCYANQEKEISNYCSAYPSRSDLKDADSKCEAAIKDYRTKTKDANKVCTALKNRTTSSSKSKKDDTVNDCSKKIEECDIATKKASSANAENPEEQKDVFSDILSGMGGLFGSDANATSSSGSCMEDFSTKDNDDAEKEYRSDRKDLQKDLNDLEDDITKEKKELDEKTTEIEKKVNEFNKDHEKEMRALDKEMRERLKANSDSLVDSGKKVRELNKKLLAVQKSVKQISFEFEKSKQDTTEQKIALKCNQAIGIAKKCMMDSYKKSAPSPDEQCKNFPKIMARGTKATAEFKAYLQNISDACYEELNTAKDRASFKNQQALDNANEEMTELQAQLKDEQSIQQNAQNDLQKIAQESDREKNELAAALAKELAALSNEQIKATETANKRIADLQKRIADMQTKLAELELKRKTGAKSATKIARSVIAEANESYDDTLKACGCIEDGKRKTTPACVSLVKNPEKIGITEPKDKKGKLVK